MTRGAGFLARPLLALAASALCVACASTGDEQPDRDDPARKAAEVNTQLGAEYMSRGQYEVALEKLKRAVRADDEYAPAHTVIAVLYEQIGESDLAGDHYRKAVRVAPDSGDANNNYGAYLCRNGRGREAFTYFDLALEDPFYRTPAVALTNAGSCAADLGDSERAEAYLRRALEFDPAFPDALLAMAGQFHERGDDFRARAFLQRHEATGAATAESLMLAYRVEARLGDERAARRYRGLVLDRFPASAQAEELRRERLR